MGKTLLEHQVDRLRNAGCTDIVLVGGAHNLDAVKDLLPGLPRVEQENLDLGMRGAMLSALPHCGTERVMVVSSNDVIESAAYEALLKTAQRCDGTLLAQRVTRYFPGGYLTLQDKRITGILEKPGEGNEPSDLVNIVAHVHNDPQALLKALEDVSTVQDDGYELALARMFASHTYEATPYTGSWQAVKYPWHMLDLLPLFLQSIQKPVIHKTAFVHPTAVVDGAVILEEGVRVMAHATVAGPCYVGKNTVVANNALLRGSMTGERCVVGYSTEVKGSILCDDVWTHMSYVGDSVVGNNVSFGGGCVTGNLRLDEGEISSVVQGEKLNTRRAKLSVIIGDNCRLGIQVNTNPGVKIGQGTFINSVCVLGEDVPEKSFGRMKDGKFVISENTSPVPQPAGREKYRPQ